MTNGKTRTLSFQFKAKMCTSMKSFYCLQKRFMAKQLARRKINDTTIQDPLLCMFEFEALKKVRLSNQVGYYMARLL